MQFGISGTGVFIGGGGDGPGPLQAFAMRDEDDEDPTRLLLWSAPVPSGRYHLQRLCLQLHAVLDDQ